jgi:hypothetical protein
MTLPGTRAQLFSPKNKLNTCHLGNSCRQFHPGTLPHAAGTRWEAAMSKFLAFLGLLALTLTGGVSVVTTLLNAH